MPEQVNPPIVCTQELTVQPVVTRVEGVPNFRKQQAVSIVMGQQATILYTMRDPTTGDPVNLAPCLASGATVVAKFTEGTIGLTNRINQPITIPCFPNNNVTNGADGVIKCTLPECAVQYPGIYRCEFGLLDTDGNLVFSNELWVMINRGQFADRRQPPLNGPPTLPEIRLHLRDSDPVDNLWLLVQEFDTAEIAACIMRPIDYFNEAPPPIRQKFSTANFPGRYHWLEAIIGCLYSMASLHYTRVHLPYQQQQGLTVDDKNKAEQYAAIAKERWENWKEWVRHKKVQLNAASAFRTLGSQYYGRGWWES